MYYFARSFEPPVVGRQHIDPVVVGREKPGRLSQVWSTEKWSLCKKLKQSAMEEKRRSWCLGTRRLQHEMVWSTVRDLTSSQFGINCHLTYKIRLTARSLSW